MQRVTFGHTIEREANEKARESQATEESIPKFNPRQSLVLLLIITLLRHWIHKATKEVEVVDTAARNARDAIVTTELHGGAVPLKVRWRVIERKGSWSVVDLEVAGIWLAIEQRAQVASILSRPGADIDDVIAQFG